MFFQEYFTYVKNTESPTIYHRWCALSLVSTLLARNISFPLGHYNIYPNQYILLVGTPGTRKGCAKIPRNLLKKLNYNNFAPERVAKETFLSTLTQEEFRQSNQDNFFEFDLEEEQITETYINSEEFTNFIGSGNFEFISILGELYDCPTQYSYPLKRSKSIYIEKPTFNILSCSTPDALASALPHASIGQGALSRFLLIFAAPSGIKLTFPPPPSRETETKLLDICKEIRGCKGVVTKSKRAEFILDWLYKNWSGLEDQRFSYYNQRRFTHLIKIAIACAASRLSTNLEEEDVILANTVLSYAEQTMDRALGEFGAAKSSIISHKIVSFLDQALRVISLDELWIHVRTDLDKYTDLLPILQGLIRGEKIQQVDGGFLPLKKIKCFGKDYVDLTLLEEIKEAEKC